MSRITDQPSQSKAASKWTLASAIVSRSDDAGDADRARRMLASLIASRVGEELAALWGASPEDRGTGGGSMEGLQAPEGLKGGASD